MVALIKSPVLSAHAIDLFSWRNTTGKSVHAAVSSPAQETMQSLPPSQTRPRPEASLPSTESGKEDSAPLERGIDPARHEEILKECLRSQEETLGPLREKAVADGFLQGLAEGRNVGAAEFSGAVDALQRMVDSGKASVMTLLEDTEEVIGAIVFEAVCKILGKQLVRPETCAAMVSEMLSRVRQEDIVAVRVSPRDHEQIRLADPDSVPGLAELSGYSIEPDDRIELGGCILKLQGENLDARIETQLRAFAQSLKDAARNQ